MLEIIEQSCLRKGFLKRYCNLSHSLLISSHLSVPLQVDQGWSAWYRGQARQGRRRWGFMVGIPTGDPRAPGTGGAGQGSWENVGWGPMPTGNQLSQFTRNQGFLGYRTSMRKPRKFPADGVELVTAARVKSRRVCTEPIFSSLPPTTPQTSSGSCASPLSGSCHPPLYPSSRTHSDCLKLKSPIGLGKRTKLRPKWAIMEMQIETTMRYHFTPTSMAVIKKMDQVYVSIIRHLYKLTN